MGRVKMECKRDGEEESECEEHRWVSGMANV